MGPVMESSLRNWVVEWVLENYRSLDEAVNDLLWPIEEEYHSRFSQLISEISANVDVENFKLDRLTRFYRLFPEVSRFVNTMVRRMAEDVAERVRQDMFARFKDLRDVTEYIDCKETCNVHRRVILRDFFKEQYFEAIRDEYRDFFEWYERMRRSFPREIEENIPEYPQVPHSSIKKLTEDLVTTHFDELKWFAEVFSELRESLMECWFEDYITMLYCNLGLAFPLPSSKFLEINAKRTPHTYLRVGCINVIFDDDSFSLNFRDCTPDELLESYTALEEIARDPRGLLERAIRNLYVIAEIALEVWPNDSGPPKAMAILENEYYRVFGEPLLTGAREEELKRKWLEVFNKLKDIKKKFPEVKGVFKCERRGDIAVCVISYTGKGWFAVVKAFRLGNNIVEPVFEMQLSSFVADTWDFYYFEDVDVVIRALGVLEDMLKTARGDT